MAITAAEVIARTKTKDPADLVEKDITAAAKLLAGLIDDIEVAAQIPPEIYDLAHLAVTIELYNTRKAPNGQPNQQYAAEGAGNVYVQARVNRDPLVPAYALLRDYVSPVGFA